MIETKELKELQRNFKSLQNDVRITNTCLYDDISQMIYQNDTLKELVAIIHDMQETSKKQQEHLKMVINAFENLSTMLEVALLGQKKEDYKRARLNFLPNEKFN